MRARENSARPCIRKRRIPYRHHGLKRIQDGHPVSLHGTLLHDPRKVNIRDQFE
jgi:hypothetical protein